MTTETPPLAVGWESLPWPPPGPTRRVEPGLQGRDYRAAVPARIAALDVHLASVAAAEADDARDAIARYDTTTPGPGAGHDGPVSRALALAEALCSCLIEHISADPTEVALADLVAPVPGSPAALVVAARDATIDALATTSPTTAQTLLDLHATLARGQDHAGPGRFRTEQVWIGNTPTPHDAVFVPPRHERIPAAIKDLAVYLARTDVPLITQIAIAHAQIETIHPFTDGNGRLGRALIQAMLSAAGATTATVLPVSAGLLADTRGYVAALTAYRAGEATPIVDTLTGAIYTAIHRGWDLAEHLHDNHTGWATRLTARPDATARRVLPVLIGDPAVTSRNVQDRLAVSASAADHAIGHLLDAGIITDTGLRHRGRIYLATDVTDALSNFLTHTRRG